MGKTYVGPILGQWKDDVGGKLHAEANLHIKTVNAVAETMDDALKKVDRHRNDKFEYQSKTPDIEALKNRLQQQLGV